MESIVVKELLKHKDELYMVLKKMPISYFNNKNNQINPGLFNGWKEHLGADKVLKTQTHFIYCETVPDAEWEDLPQQEVSEPIGPGI